VRALLLALLAASCGGSAPPEPPVGLPASPQLPPQGQPALEAWLAEGHYRSWACEAEISAPRLSGTHGRHRVCSNDKLLASSDALYPPGAASVKELYDPMDGPNGFAVGIKIAEGDGPRTWYWYERRGAVAGVAALAEGVAVPDCAVCHGTAPRDYVFIRAE
jgi:hypothetical protein